MPKIAQALYCLDLGTKIVNNNGWDSFIGRAIINYHDRDDVFYSLDHRFYSTKTADYNTIQLLEYAREFGAVILITKIY